MPQHPVHRELEVTVACGKLRDGKRYTVRALLFGHPAEDTFVAMKPPQPKAKAKAKKATAKKTAKKRSTKKKTAKKS